MNGWKETELGVIPDDWNVLKVADIAKKMSDAPFGTSIKNRDYRNDGVTVIQGKNIAGRKCDWSDIRFVSIEKYNSLPRSQCSIGDLIFPKVGTIGKVGILTQFEDREEYLLSTNTMMFRGNPEWVEQDFVYYYFSDKRVENLINRLNPNSVQPVFNFTSLKNFLIPIPPLDEQRRIAAVLSTLDAKIDLLHRQNHTLERIAQTLFNRWFVEFEFPFDFAQDRPDDEGQPYKSSGGPMVESEVGEIPQGWLVGKLDDISVNFDSTRIPLSSRDRQDRQGIYPYYGASGIIDYIDDYIFEGEYILFSEDGENLRSRKTPIVFIVNGKFWVNNHAHILRGKKDYYFYFLYLFLARADISHIITGAVQPKVNQANLNSLELLIPEDMVVRYFDQIVTLIFRKITINETQIQTLTQLRDTLLPKLMSGQLRVAG